MAVMYVLWLVAVHATLSTQLPNDVTIVRMDVPTVVTLNAQPAVVLDCEYNVTESEGLVVKWFFNKPNNLVYQWIPSHKPQSLSILKGKLDLEYKVSDSPLQSQRALRIVSPGVDLSGNYTCVVSTFLSEDRVTKPMLIFSPGHKLEFEYIRQESDDTVHFVCSVESVYPLPIITIKKFSISLPNQKLEVEPKTDGLYDLMVLTKVKDSELLSGDKFVCEMRIPEANYTARENIIYSRRSESTTTESLPTIESIKVEDAEAASSSNTHRPTSTLLLLLFFKLFALSQSVILILG